MYFTTDVNSSALRWRWPVITQVDESKTWFITQSVQVSEQVLSNVVSLSVALVIIRDGHLLCCSLNTQWTRKEFKGVVLSTRMFEGMAQLVQV